MSSAKEQESYIGRLIRLKVWTLLHDPPNKMWLIRKFGNEFRNKHEEVAKNFATQILNGTIFAGAPSEEELKFIRLVDYIASSFDRWILRISVGGSYYLFYNHLHNIFSPERSIKLEEPLTDDFHEFQRELNEILLKVEGLTSKAGEDGEKKYGVIYNTIYLLLEALWYKKGYHPSLADTRVPTHTVFDHLYASALAVNMMLSGYKDRRLEGYFVVIDFPGVQKFVGGRKAGDYWASSWILSNVSWATALNFAYGLGFDVILSPSPRLNPYTFRSVLAYLLNLAEGGTREDVFRRFYTVFCRDAVSLENVKDIFIKICDVAKDVYDVKDYSELDFLLYQPIIPATISLILPPIAKSPSDLANDIVDYYKKSWSLLYDVVLDKLEHVEEIPARNLVKKFLYSVLSKHKYEAKVPPQGITVFVINIGSIYDKVRRCIYDSDREACRDVLLELDKDSFDRILGEIRRREDVLNQLVLKLTYHITVSNYRRLANMCHIIDDPECGTILYSTPRSFWYYSTEGQEYGKLEPVIQTSYRVERRTWFTCNVCGDEPAVLLFKKVVGVDGVEDYSMDTKEVLAEFIPEIKTEQKVLDDLKKFMRPGEGIGIYCLFKRGVYLAYRDVLDIPSTDDVALALISRLMHKLSSSRDEEAKQIYEAFVHKLSEQYREILEYLYHYPSGETGIRYVKDVEALAKVHGKRLDTLVNEVNDTLRKVCVEVLRNNQSYAEKFKEYVMKILDLDDIDKELGKYIKDGSGRLSIRSIGSLCNLIGIPLYYTVVRGDADNIGKVLRGELVDSLEGYVDRIVRSIEKHVNDSTKIDVIKASLKLWISLVNALNLRSLPTSPATHSTISMALMLSAIDDYKVIREFNGFMVFSGGDDVLAFFPLISVFSGVKKLREVFEGKYTSGTIGFKKVKNNIPITSALTTGRSFSIRIANLMDVMGYEVSKASELLESKAKEIYWEFLGRVTPQKSFKKDSTVISDSRSQVYVVIPNKELASDIYPYTHLLKIIYILLLGSLSRNTPEDVEHFIGKAYEYIDSEKLRKFVNYILKRNLVIAGNQDKDIVVESLMGSNVAGLHMMIGTIGGDGGEKINLALQFLDNFIRIVRRHI